MNAHCRIAGCLLMGSMLAACPDTVSTEPAGLSTGVAADSSGTMTGSEDSTGTTDSAAHSTGADYGIGDSSGGGGSFITFPDWGPHFLECDVFAQDCPDGEKCMPWAYESMTWNSTRCSPIYDEPDLPGDPCIAEGSPTTGIDSCDIGSVCWNVDPETNTGTCMALCTGHRLNPKCGSLGAECIFGYDGIVALCLTRCNPVLRNCDTKLGCHPFDDEFACFPTDSGNVGTAGDPCEYPTACAPGLVCLDASAWPGCAGSIGCCTPVCDLSAPRGDPQCPGMGQTCQAWYEDGTAPPGYEDVGACALPT